METAWFGKGEATELFVDTGFDRFYDVAVLGSRVVSRLTSQVALPEKIELPTDRPLIIAANHSSLFDLAGALIFLGHFGLCSRIGVNSRFFTNPAVGAFFRGLGCVPFSKEDKASAEATMINALRSGQTAAIMPEGRLIRAKDQVDGVGEGRPGVSRIARATDAAVLPIGFAFANEAWNPGTPLPKPRLGRHQIIASVGSPIVFETDDHIANANQLMAEIGHLVLEGRQSR